MCYLIAKNDNKNEAQHSPKLEKCQVPLSKKKMIKEESKVALVTSFYFTNEGNNLNFNLIKE